MQQALVVGLFQGATYGLLAVGLVLVYKGTRVFNFMQAEFGTVAAFVAWRLLGGEHTGGGIPMPFAILGALLAAVLLGLLMERLIVRPLLNAPRVTLLVATVGAALLTIQFELILVKPEGRVLDPIASGAITLFGASVTWQEIFVLLVLLGLAGALGYFFSRTDQGLAVLATSQDPLATRIVGISVPGMSRFIWGFAALLGAIAGVMQAPIGNFAPGFMTTRSLLPAFTGAVLGGMTSLPGAFLGGVLVGVARNLGGFLMQSAGVPGREDLTVFALLLAVLLVRPQGILGKEA